MFLRLFSLATISISMSDISTPMLLIQAIPMREAKELRETMRLHVEDLRDRKRVREMDVR